MSNGGTQRPSRQQSLEQLRAAQAWRCVQEVKGKPFSPGYRSLARGAPADIQVNGFGQSLAFWRAKGKGGNEHTRLSAHVSSWVAEQLRLKDGDLLLWIVNTADTTEYRRATAEAFAFLAWLRRFAEAELEPGPDEQAGGASQ